MALLATYGDDAYNTVLTLHILCALVGFGAIFFDAFYFGLGRARRGPEELAISDATERVSKIGEYFILAVLLLGIALVLMSDEVFEFGQAWIWLSLVLYVFGIFTKKYLVDPRLLRHRARERELVVDGRVMSTPSDDAQLASLGIQVTAMHMLRNLLMAAVLTLMVFRPGSA